MPASAFTANLAVSAPVTGPLDFASRFERWLLDAGLSFIDTPAEREALVVDVMKFYDAVGLALGKSSTVLGAMFPLMRPTVEGGIRRCLESFATPPAPAPAVVVVPQGATP